MLHLGKDYPKGSDYFRLRLKSAFSKNAQVTDPQKIEQMIKHGEFVVKEIQALYMLKKYRTLKQRLVKKEIDCVGLFFFFFF
ncbi:hypothetical protein WDU94_002111 [Cyamophila willieti]